jgi:hypothetical protein
MKRHFFVLAVFITLSLIVLTSCNEVNDPSKKLNLRSMTLSGTNSLDGDTNEVSAILYHSAGLFYNSPYGPIEMSDLTTYFTDGYSFVNPSSVYAEQNPLQRIDNFNGQYGGTVDLNSLAYDYFTWQINGYLGSNISLNQKFANPLLFTNFNWGDTISLAQGRTLNYSGYQSNSTIYVNVQNDPTSNEIYRNDTTQYSTDGFSKFIPDNGSITITPQDLSVLMPGRYYLLMIDHDYYESEPYLGTYIGKYSKYHITTTFYLSN